MLELVNVYISAHFTMPFKQELQLGFRYLDIVLIQELLHISEEHRLITLIKFVKSLGMARHV